jgi:ABC-2 type transport system ATP-binding protein
MGALIENPSIYKHLTGRQNLEVIRRMIGAPKSRVDEVLKIVRLLDNADKKAKNYSLGMCQRLGLASALLNDPDLLILDEPTNGLDPSGIIEMRELIIKLNKEHGKTIFLSSHILPEIEKMATDLAIIDNGKIMYEGKLEGINSGNSKLLKIELNDVKKATEIIKSLNYTIAEQNNKSLTLPITDKSDIAKINSALVSANIDIYQLKSTDETLEAVFLNLTKKLDQ